MGLRLRYCAIDENAFSNPRQNVCIFIHHENKQHINVSNNFYRPHAIRSAVGIGEYVSQFLVGQLKLKLSSVLCKVTMKQDGQVIAPW